MHRPSAVAKPNGSNTVIFPAKSASKRNDLRLANLSGVSTEKSDNVNLMETALDNRFKGKRFSAKEIGDINSSVDLPSIMVSEKARVGKFPRKQIVDEENGHARVRSGNVCRVGRAG